MIAPPLRAARVVVLDAPSPDPTVRPARGLTVRAARPADVSAIEALLAPEIAAGTVLAREVRAADFLVAEVDGEVAGAVALSAWTPEVIELGALVAGVRGIGIGGALTRAAVERAAGLGYRAVVALTGAPGFFRRAGFAPVPQTPWAAARGDAPGGSQLGGSQLGGAQVDGVPLGDAIAAKADRCAACPRLAGCDQALLAVRVTRRRAA